MKIIDDKYVKAIHNKKTNKQESIYSQKTKTLIIENKHIKQQRNLRYGDTIFICDEYFNFLYNFDVINNNIFLENRDSNKYYSKYFAGLFKIIPIIKTKYLSKLNNIIELINIDKDYLNEENFNINICKTLKTREAKESTRHNFNEKISLEKKENVLEDISKIIVNIEKELKDNKNYTDVAFSKNILSFYDSFYLFHELSQKYLKFIWDSKHNLFYLKLTNDLDDKCKFMFIPASRYQTLNNNSIKNKERVVIVNQSIINKNISVCNNNCNKDFKLNNQLSNVYENNKLANSKCNLIQGHINCLTIWNINIANYDSKNSNNYYSKFYTPYYLTLINKDMTLVGHLNQSNDSYNTLNFVEKFLNNYKRNNNRKLNKSKVLNINNNNLNSIKNNYSKIISYN